MPLDFPAAPAIDDNYKIVNSPQYYWDGIAWKLYPKPPTVVLVLPILTSLSPNTLTVGDPSPATITANGSNFLATSVINLNGTAMPTTFVSATELTFAVTIPKVEVVAQITVVNPDGASATLPLTIDRVKHRLTSIAPSTIALGTASPVTITCTGEGFTAASQATVNNGPATTTFVSVTSLTFPYTVPLQAQTDKIRIVTGTKATGAASLSTM